MRLKATCLVALLVAVCGGAMAAPGSGVLADLPNFKDFTVGRESSYDPTGGNADGRYDWPFMPGDTRTMADISGAGAITHIWITIASKDRHHLKNLVLRMYWDGEETPSVECPMGDFFGLGHSRYYLYSSLPIQIGSDKGLNCFWRMPFSSGAKITVTNEGNKPTIAYYYYVDYQRYDSLPETGRFHAQYRQAYPPPPGENYVFMEATGKGHYVGVNLSIHNRADGWWGEGDDMIYIDGSEKPLLQGTGSEDYFCGAWAYGVNGCIEFANPYFGAPLIDGDHKQNAEWNVYRYHLEDPVPFAKSIRATMEHGHANDRKDDFSSVAYWYQNEPHAAFPPMPKPEDRLPTEATVFTEGWVREAEKLAPDFQSDKVVVQSTLEFGNHWSDGAHLLFKAEGPENFAANLPTYPSEAGNLQLDIWYTAGPDYGQAELWLNGQKVCAWDGYNPGGMARKKLKGQFPFVLKPAGNVLELRVVGKNPASKGYLAGYDCYRAE